MALTNCTPLSQWQPKARLSSVCNPADVSFDFTWAAEPCGPRTAGDLTDVSVPIGPFSAIVPEAVQPIDGQLTLARREMSGTYSSYGRVFKSNVWVPGGTGKFFVVLHDLTNISGIPTKATRLLFLPSNSLLACESEYSTTLSVGDDPEPDESALDAAFVSAGALASIYGRPRNDSQDMYAFGRPLPNGYVRFADVGEVDDIELLLVGVDTTNNTIRFYGNRFGLLSGSDTFSVPGLSNGFFIAMYAPASAFLRTISFTPRHPISGASLNIPETDGYRWLA